MTKVLCLLPPVLTHFALIPLAGMPQPADSLVPRSPDEPLLAGSSKPSSEELARRQANMQKLRMQMDAANADR